jgi:hypothetical protein
MAICPAGPGTRRVPAPTGPGAGANFTPRVRRGGAPKCHEVYFYSFNSWGPVEAHRKAAQAQNEIYGWSVGPVAIGWAQSQWERPNSVVL